MSQTSANVTEAVEIKLGRVRIRLELHKNRSNETGVAITGTEISYTYPKYGVPIKTGGVSCASITLIVRVDEDDRNCSLPLKLPPPSWKKSHTVLIHIPTKPKQSILSEGADILSLVVYTVTVFWYVSAHKLYKIFKIFASDLVHGQTGQCFGYYPDDDGDKVRLGFLIVEHFPGFYADDTAVSVDGKQSGLGVLEQTARHI